MQSQILRLLTFNRSDANESDYCFVMTSLGGNLNIERLLHGRPRLTQPSPATYYARRLSKNAFIIK